MTLAEARLEVERACGKRLPMPTESRRRYGSKFVSADGLNVGDRLSLELVRRLIAGRRLSRSTGEKSTKQVTVEIVGAGWAIVSDGKRRYRLEGNSMADGGSRPVRYEILSLVKA